MLDAYFYISNEILLYFFVIIAGSILVFGSIHLVIDNENTKQIFNVLSIIFLATFGINLINITATLIFIAYKCTS